MQPYFMKKNESLPPQKLNFVHGFGPTHKTE